MTIVESLRDSRWFVGCDHPMEIVIPVPYDRTYAVYSRRSGTAALSHHITQPSFHRIRHCLTCGAIDTGYGAGWKESPFGVDYQIRWDEINRFDLVACFAFYFSQRPASRVFGDVNG